MSPIEGLLLLFARCFFFFFNDTATTEIYTLSLHDALPIFPHGLSLPMVVKKRQHLAHLWSGDRKSTRLNSSHSQISYAVFCLKKKQPYSTPTGPTSPTTSTQTPGAVGGGL